MAEAKEEGFVTRDEFDSVVVSRRELEEALSLVSTLDESDLEGLARKTELTDLATKSDLKDLRTHLRRSLGTRMGIFKSKRRLDVTL